MDLFNNPMVNNALKDMSSEDLEKYKKVGEQLYGNTNFVDSTLINSLMSPTDEAVAYVEEGIKSGLLPEDLEENEVILLEKTFGEEWYKRYGFLKENVPESGLSLKVKRDIDNAIQTKIDETLAVRKKKKNKKKNRK